MSRFIFRGKRRATLSREGLITIMDTRGFSVIATLEGFDELKAIDSVNRFVIARRQNSRTHSVVDYVTGTAVRELEPHPFDISTDGTRMAIRTAENIVSILSLPGFEERERFEVQFPSGGDVFILKLSRTGERLIAAPGGQEFVCLKLNDGSRRFYETDHRRGIGNFVFSPDDRYVVTASPDGIVKVVELMNGEIESYSPNFMSVNDQAFSPDGRILAVIMGAKRIWMMDWETRQEMLVIPGFGGIESRVFFSQDGNSLLIYQARNGHVSVLRGR